VLIEDIPTKKRLQVLHFPPVAIFMAHVRQKTLQRQGRFWKRAPLLHKQHFSKEKTGATGTISGFESMFSGTLVLS
jgi:hypothetical protein